MQDSLFEQVKAYHSQEIFMLQKKFAGSIGLPPWAVAGWRSGRYGIMIPMEGRRLLSTIIIVVAEVQINY